MRVLVQVRPNRGEREGGDTLHAERKADELRALGVDVAVSGEWAPDLAGHDLVHLYNTQAIEATLRRALRARACGLPVVLETIYWDPSYFRLPEVHRHEEGMRSVALALADRLLPSSAAEGRELARRFPGVDGRVRVVPLGVESRPGREGDASRFCARHGLEPGFVLCVARKEERKNQLRLIRACGSLRLPLVLVGAEYPEAAPYVAACREAAAAGGSPVTFLPYLDDGEVADAYAAAGVHALPSIWETVGLSSLEAALAGCNVVTTEAAGIPEYLRDDAWYCDPWSEESIAAAVAAAHAASPQEGLAERLRREFSWRRAAELTLVAYEEAMSEHDERSGGPPLPQEQYVEHLEELVQLQLEAIAFREERLEALHAHAATAGQGEAAAQVRAELAEARAELAHLHATKLFRWSAPARALWGRLRRG